MRVTVRCYRLRMKITGSDCLIDNLNCCDSGNTSSRIRPGLALPALQPVLRGASGSDDIPASSVKEAIDDFSIDPFLPLPARGSG
jgi:hypothetical protein